MNLSIILSILLFTIVANARYHEKPDESLENEDEQDRYERNYEHRIEKNRHRKKRQNPYDAIHQLYPYYGMPVPIPAPNTNTCPEKELLETVMKAFTALAQRSTPNIYVDCGKANDKGVPEVGNRGRFDDRNWGMIPAKYNRIDDDGDAFINRPLNLIPKKPVFSPSWAPVQTTRSPFGVENSKTRQPDVCDLAYIACCHQTTSQERANCIVSVGCLDFDDSQSKCSKEELKKIVDALATSYKMKPDDDIAN